MQKIEFNSILSLNIEVQCINCERLLEANIIVLDGLEQKILIQVDPTHKCDKQKIDLT